jgi:hypothetical protein
MTNLSSFPINSRKVKHAGCGFQMIGKKMCLWRQLDPFCLFGLLLLLSVKQNRCCSQHSLESLFFGDACMEAWKCVPKLSTLMDLYIHPLYVLVSKILSFRLAAVGTLKRYSKALEYEYRVKTAALDTLKRYSILSLTLYLE